MKTKEEQIKEIEATIEQLQGQVSKLKSKSPEEKYNELTSSLGCIKYVPGISQKVGAFRRLLWIAEALNERRRSVVEKKYIAAIINGKADWLLNANSPSIDQLFRSSEDAIASFDYLTDEEIECLYGRRIER